MIVETFQNKDQEINSLFPPMDFISNIYDATAKFIFYCRQAETSPVLLVKYFQKQTYCRIAIYYKKY